jgi:membrane-associated phospholipid phosphatase
VSSVSYSSEQSKAPENALTLSRRILWIAIACLIQMIYIPTSNRITGGIEPRLPIDVFPVWPIWVLPYVGCYILWLASIAWVILKMEDRLFRSFIAACILTFCIGVSTFLFFPTYVEPASLPGNDIFTSLLRVIHENWGRYDALPSGHVYITTLLALFYGRWYPHYRPVWLAILAIVSLSTLFTGQHYILDVIGGLLLGLAGYNFGLWWTGFHPAQRRAGKRVPSSSLN